MHKKKRAMPTLAWKQTKRVLHPADATPLPCSCDPPAPASCTLKPLHRVTPACSRTTTTNPCRSRHQARHEIISGSIKLSSRRPVISSREACFAVVWEPASGFKFCLQNLFLRFCNDNLISTINRIIHFIAFVKRAYHMMISRKMFKRAILLLWLQIELNYIIADVGCWT